VYEGKRIELGEEKVKCDGGDHGPTVSCNPNPRYVLLKNLQSLKRRQIRGERGSPSSSKKKQRVRGQRNHCERPV